MQGFFSQLIQLNSVSDLSREKGRLRSGRVSPREALAIMPVIERVLPFGSPCDMLGLQFRSGRLFVNGHGPGTTKEQAEADWKIIDEAGGMDVAALSGTEALQFWGEGCLFLKANAPQWQEATAADIVTSLKDTTWIVGILQPTRTDLPLTAYFKTARGEMGILQLLDIVRRFSAR